jgi:hypothetical protein
MSDNTYTFPLAWSEEPDHQDEPTLARFYNYPTQTSPTWAMPTRMMPTQARRWASSSPW